ncbi:MULTISPECIES: sigma-54-dependent Fis family transcriptional regulator [unclassified Modicisalibacter]|uniref:sigma-54-dependent Fis family transcriptional regulator n=1 Tax=unclassified Modicisalibacter TaxID=2679913 RepID=UPI001CCEB983|nr:MULTISPECIES: sigma-54-dependent Fis family transcriptional regulator [unclassified Modicisalibacter]MBZ9557895.1 sigma-54-dependent Fis family transcriptional regulator [Modicisalibacter sp. R2A 31.J]MBZ9573438.1 sigma-54-dependent Fis family transcriptional regulator [Modicisalibacter sp. MOD 31.J]
MPLRNEQRQHIETLVRLSAGQTGGLDDCREVIRRSWERCVDEYRLDPGRPRPVRVLTQQALREHRESVDELLHVARAGVDQLFTQIAPLGYVLLLTDRRGITVDFRGQRGQDAELRRAGLYLGADWDERYAGTCAVGTCVHDAQAITCHQREHFDATHIGLTCTAAPITDPQGNVIAVLDISALQSPRSQASQNFGLPLVSLYARMIEDAYFLHRYRDCLILRFDAAREFVHLNGRGLIAIEEDGSVIAANGEGRALIEAHLRRWPAWTPGWVPAVTQLFDAELGELLSIPATREDHIRAFRVRAGDTSCFATLIEPRSRRPAARVTPSSPTPVPALDRLAADDAAMHRLLKLARRLRNEAVSVLITGETGTGKEVLARALHDSGSRAGGPFVAVNCAAIPESLIESELFGYLPGAFTGGRSKGMRGLIQQADGGTLFLDEIGDMPLSLQTRLLRVLAEREVMPLGAEKAVRVDLRVITATHRDMNALIAGDRFREDLYYRLNGAQLHLPALRERADRHYVIRCVYDALVAERGSDVRLRADAMSALLAYAWPGNIRQLRNALDFALATVEGDEITVHDLPETCQGELAGAPQLIDAAPPAMTMHEGRELQALLQDAGWNVSRVARRLGVSRPTVYRRMRRHGLVPPNRRETQCPTE